MKDHRFDYILPLIKKVGNIPKLDDADLLENFKQIDSLMFKIKNNRQINNPMLIVKNDLILDEIKNIILKDPAVLRVQNKMGQNLGMLASNYKVEPIIELSLEDAVAYKQQDCKHGNFIAMYVANNKLEDLVISILDNPKIAVQQNFQGEILGMCCAYNHLEKATLKALDNVEASRRVSKIGYNTGAYAIVTQLKEPSLKALKDPVAGKHRIPTGQLVDELAIREFGADAEKVISKRESKLKATDKAF